jgi:hypothetical protein
VENKEQGKIDDDGVFVPGAVKHTRDSTGAASDSSVSLDSLWPEPDWHIWILNGIEPDIVAHLAVLYKGLRTKPRPPQFSLSAAQWESGYKRAIKALQAHFLEIRTRNDLGQIHRRHAQMLDLDYERLHANKLQFSISYPYYAAGHGGTRTVSPNTILSVRQEQLAKWATRLGWPQNSNVLRAGLVPILFTDMSWRVCKVYANGYSWNEVPYATEQEAMTATLDAITKFEVAPPRSKRIPIPERPVAKDVQRVGPDWRQGRDVGTEQLMAEYRLRAVQFGESLSQKERQQWVNEAFDALADLADICGIPRTWIGLGQPGLAVAFGARGRSNAMAHFEPTLRVINLTRRRGAGSLAHEWGHALDNRLCITMGAALLEGHPYISEVIPLGWGTELEKRENGKYRGVIRQYEQFSSAVLTARASAFLQRSHAIARDSRGGRYFIRRRELFARAFESSIQDMLAKQARMSPWLVYGTRAEDYQGVDQRYHPYPEGTERDRISGIFAGLMAALSALTSARAPAR